ncbi:MAG: PAC2 family protein [Actinomycetota bacterium]|nr:MAG: PAC2 family protein [Actinomycetota bacterium]
MAEYRPLYDETGPVPEGAADGDGPVLLHAFQGFLDAGSSGELVAAHLKRSLPGRELVRFDLDELFDYRSRRSSLVFSRDHYEEYDAPELTLHELQDAAGERFLLLSGPEPDLRWSGFVRDVIGLVDRLGVRLTVGVGGVPMTVPHTRPITLTMHGTRPELVTQQNPWQGMLRVPGSVAALLELRLGESGHDAVGFVAHVPHYTAGMEYPDAAAALLAGVGSATGLSLPAGELAEAGAERVREIETQVRESAEVQAVVTALEQQYDASLGAQGPGLAQRDLPSGEEIGAELERFLAQLDHGDDKSS